MRPFALQFRGPKAAIFELSDTLGFDSEMETLAVSMFDDSDDTSHVQALFETQAQAQACLAGLAFPQTLEYSIYQLPDEDWVSLTQAGLPPVEAGRFWVYGSHDAGSVPHNKPFPVLVDAGMAFGTGHHGTTRGCLLAFDTMLTAGQSFDRVLDLGCGTGVLAIAAAKALQRTVWASDIDQDAIDVTLENAAINAVTPHIKAFQADGFESVALKDQQFDFIFANILAGPLVGLAPDIVKALQSGGTVVLSGILNEQADWVSGAFTESGLTVARRLSEGEWTTLVANRPQ